MNNMRMLVRNIIEEAISVSASPAVLATLPETNLLLPTERGRTARSQTTAAQQFTFSFGADMACSMVAYSRHNLTPNVGTLCSVLNDSYPVVLHDTGPVVALSTSSLDADVDDDPTDPDFAFLRNSVHYFDLQTTMDSLEVTATDAANADGYLEITKVLAGKYRELTYNPEGVDLQIFDAGSSSRAEDGTHSVDKGAKWRVITINLAAIENAGDLNWLLGAARRLGKDGECWLDLYPHNTAAMGIYGRGVFRLADSPTFNHAQFGHHKNTMRFEET